MSKFLSGRQSNLKLGVAGYTESKTVLETTGKVGIGTTDAQSSSLFVVGDTNFKGNVNLGDNDKLKFGDDDDLEIFHNSSNGNTIIQETTGGNLVIKGSNLFLQSSSGEDFFKGDADGAVTLYYDDSKKFETTGYGATVYNDLNVGTGVTIYGNAGIVSATAFYGDGSNLENTGATLSAAAGTQRLVVTSLTSGTMVDAATDGDLTFNATTNTLNTDNLIVAGNLTVSGDQTILNTTSLEVEDINIGIASANPKLNDAQLNGAGITIHGLNGDKTLTWDNSNSRLGFNTDVNVANLKLDDHQKVTFGDSDDLQIYHAGGSSIIKDQGNGSLSLRGDDVNIKNAAGGEFKAKFFTNGAVELYYDNSKKFETTGIGVSIYNDLNVGTGVTIYGNAGIVSATSFFGDGSNLTNTGATLSATSGVERLVTTQLTSGTMVDAATDADLTFDAGTNTLNTDNIKISGGISTNGSSYGQDQQLLRSTGTGWEWATVPGIFSVNNILNGFNVLEEGSTVGTAGSIHTLDFRGINVFASGDPQPNGIATITFSPTPTFTGVNLTGVSTITGTITAGSSEGVNGQYLRHVGTGVTWASFPTLRVTRTDIATAGQTTFNFSYNVDFLDVFVNGVKLTSTEYTATNGNQIVLNTPAFADEVVEFHSYNVASTYSGGGGGGGASNLNGLTDVTIGTLTDKDILQYQSSSGEWENVTLSSTGVVTSIITNTSDIVSLSDSNGVYTIDVAVGAGGTWATDFVGINTTKNVGIGTTAKDGYKLYVEGDARVTGILTVGPASVTIDGINNSISCTTVSAGGSVTATQLYGDASNVTGIVTSNIGKANVTISDNPPGIGTAHGDLWWESDTAKGHIYYNDGSSAQWVEFNPSSGGGGGGGGGSYGNSDVDSHLNVSGASSGQILSWNGSDYAWVADQTGGGGSGITTANINADTIDSGTLNVSGVSTFTADKVFFKNGGTPLPATLQIETGVAGVGNTIRSSNSLDLVTNGSAFKLELNTTNAIIAGGTGAAQYVQLYGSGSEKLKTIGSGVTVTGTAFSDQLSVSGVATATSFVKSGGTSSQYLMADGSVTTASGGSGIGNVSEDTTPQLGGDLDLNSNDISGSGTISATKIITSKWTLGANGSSDYTFTGPGLTGTVNDPTIYLIRGQSYQFANNSGGHPFRIQSTPNGSAGTQYNTGVTNNDAGNGATLTFDVPFDAPDVLYYQCTAHPNMGGKIVITAPPKRFTTSASTGSIAAAATQDITIAGCETYALLKIQTSHAAWVRLYTDTTSRTNDASRAYTTDPTPGSGVLAEVYTTTSGSNTFKMTPGVIGWNDDGTPSSNIYAKVTNNESGSADVTVTLTIVRMED